MYKLHLYQENKSKQKIFNRCNSR